MADNDKMREISEMLEQGVRDLFTTEQYTTYLRAMDKFHEYSFNNQVLIAAQKPDATLVAGYQAWQKNFNRHVKRGEKGIKIIAPMPAQRTVTRDKKDEQTGDIVRDSDGTPQTEEVSITVPRFRAVTVFDVSQTEGEPLPERPGAETLTAHVDNYSDFMKAIRKVSPVPIRFDDDIPGTANGYYDATAKEIVIRAGMPEAQTVKTAIHEVTHARLHDPDRAGGRIDQITREVEAESTAFIVCNRFGIDTSEYTFPYIAAWSGSVEMKELKESMEKIRTAASEIIDELNAQMEPEQAHEEAVSFDREPESPVKQTGQAKYQQVELFGVPVLFSNNRIAEEDVPPGLYRYDLRGADSDPGRPSAIEKSVTVNHAGTVLSPVRIPYLDHNDHLSLGDSLRFTDSREKTVDEFQKLWGDLEKYPKTAEVMNNNIIQANEGLVWIGHDSPHAEHEDIYAIYQISKDGVPYEFMSMDFAKRHNMDVNAGDYSLVYGGSLSGIEAGTELDTLYQRFNMARPENFSGHSMSVSDVVILNRGDKVQAWYVDSIGYTPLPDFVIERAAELNRTEMSQDVACRKAIEVAINSHFDGTRLDKNSANAVIEEFGISRVQHVLAVTVCQKDHDGRFSPDTKTWAHEVMEGKANTGPEDSWSKCVVDSHPAVLDGFIWQVRKYAESTRDMDQEKAVEGFAERLDNFAQQYDTYEYKDNVTSPDQHVSEITEQIQNGNTNGLKTWLKGIIDTSNNQADVAEAQALSQDLNSIEGNDGRENIRTVYAPAYDNGKWHVAEINLSDVRWFGHTMEYQGIAYDRSREMYTTEDAAWKYINNDASAYRDLVKFDDEHRPYLVTSKESEKISSNEIKDELPPKKRSIATRVKRNQGIIQKTQRQSLYREERSELSL